MNKRILTAGLLTVILLSASFRIPVQAATVQASDIKGHWAFSAITQALAYGFVKTNANGLFLPNNNISRSDFISWADLAMGTVIKWEPGATEGLLKTLSIPAGTTVTRQQAARILAAMLKMDGMAGSSKLMKMKDMSTIHMPALGAVGALMDCGIISGYTDDTFRPTRVLTRAEAIVLLGKVAMKANAGIAEKPAVTPTPASLALPDSAAAKSYEGLIIDKHCFPLGNPEQDTLLCLKMETCAASGYGLAVKRTDGTWSFTLFGADSQKSAATILEKTTKKSNVTVTATGTVKTGVLSLTGLVEKP